MIEILLILQETRIRRAHLLAIKDRRTAQPKAALTLMNKALRRRSHPDSTAHHDTAHPSARCRRRRGKVCKSPSGVSARCRADQPSDLNTLVEAVAIPTVESPRSASDAVDETPPMQARSRVLPPVRKRRVPPRPAICTITRCPAPYTNLFQTTRALGCRSLGALPAYADVNRLFVTSSRSRRRVGTVVYALFPRRQ